MSREKIELEELLGNVLSGEHGDVLRGMLAEMLRAVMEAEVRELCSADYNARAEGRTNRRNGYRDRPLETRLGTVDLKIPKLRKGSYLPSFVEPRRRWEKAFVNVVSEAYVKGVSTRSVEDLVAAMGAKGMSRSEVSRMAAVLDEQVDAFRRRPLGEKACPYLWLDAMYVKVRENHRVVSRAVLVAIAVNEDGEREVLGVDVAEKEMESSWRAFLRDLLARGLRGVQLVISDAHEGLRAAIPAVFNGATWQRCYVHYIRNVLDKVPKSAQGFVAAALRTVFGQVVRGASPGGDGQGPGGHPREVAARRGGSGVRRGRCVGVLLVPASALEADPVDQSAGAAEQGAAPSGACGGDLPDAGIGAAADWDAPGRAGRRVESQ